MQHLSPLLNHPFAQNSQEVSIFAISVLLPNLVEMRFTSCWYRGNNGHITTRQVGKEIRNDHNTRCLRSSDYDL